MEKKTWVSSGYRFPVLIQFLLLPILLFPIAFAQLTPSEKRILFQIQELLEYPSSLQGWSTNWTNFCYLPPTRSLTVICSGHHITELTVIGNKTSTSTSPLSPRSAQETLSERFSIDSFFTTLTKLSSLKVLSLVSLGLWGPLPEKISRFKSLQVLNLSSNSIYGEIPQSISKLENLRSLVLSYNLFNGSVPDLSYISVLEELDLGNNLLGPELPSFGDKIVSVVLRNNTFVSQIPLGFKNFDQLKHFDVSFNQIIGRIPPVLLSLPSIEYLNLAGNKLSGMLPANTLCNEELGFVDFSHNSLSGKLPICLRSNASNRAVYYSWNCLSVGDLDYQHPSNFCHEEALAVKPPSRVIEKKRSTNALGLLVGIVAAVVGGLVVMGLLLFVLLRRVLNARQTDNNAYDQQSAGRKDSLRLSPKILTDARHVTPAMRLGSLGLPQYHVFSIEDIEEATNNFDPANLMGEGSQGQLYKGRLSRDGSVVVIRCLKLKEKLSSQSLLQHMEDISKLRHRHLVSILGHCIETYQDYPNAANTVYLVFEFVSNGTLRTHLTDWRKRDMMKWPERVAVTIGVARGIQFLHSGVTPGVFGNNLKIENILLDEHLTAKISTYYLPMPFMVGSGSSFNGLESVDHLDGEKNDVYQLGVILLEAITGKPITSQNELDAQRLQLERALADASTKLRGVADPTIRGTFAYDSLRTTVEITLKCLSKDSRQRPSIEDVLWHLQYSVQVQEGWMPSSEIF